MHKQIRIINASLSGQGSWEPGGYAAFALGPSLPAPTPGTPGASPAQWRAGDGGDALGAQDGGTGAQWVQAGAWQKQDLVAVVKRGFMQGWPCPSPHRQPRASQASSWGCRGEPGVPVPSEYGAVFKLPQAPCCSWVCSKRRSALYFGQRIGQSTDLSGRPALGARAQALPAEEVLGTWYFIPEFTLIISSLPCSMPCPWSLKQGLSPDLAQSF